LARYERACQPAPAGLRSDQRTPPINRPNDAPVSAQHAQLPENSSWGLVFQGVNSVSLAVVTSKVLLDILRDRREARHKPQATEESLGPLVRHVEQALAAHDARRGRGA